MSGLGGEEEQKRGCYRGGRKGGCPRAAGYSGLSPELEALTLTRGCPGKPPEREAKGLSSSFSLPSPFPRRGCAGLGQGSPSSPKAWHVGATCWVPQTA